MQVCGYLDIAVQEGVDMQRFEYTDIWIYKVRGIQKLEYKGKRDGEACGVIGQRKGSDREEEKV